MQKDEANRSQICCRQENCYREAMCGVEKQRLDGLLSHMMTVAPYLQCPSTPGLSSHRAVPERDERLQELKVSTGSVDL